MQKFSPQLFYAGSIGLTTVLSSLLINQAAIAQNIGNLADTCFMVTSSGKRLDLGHLCTKNPQVVIKPKPVQKVAAISNFPTSNFPTSININAFLKVIRYAEGTDAQDGYQIQYTGARFYSFTDHPRIARCGNIRGKSVCSTAAGAYQFLDTTWDDVASSIGAPDFSPTSQDRGAIELIYRAGALQDIESGNIARAIGKLAPVWASFPRWDGDMEGAYGQSVVSMNELLQVFQYYQQAEASNLRNIKQSIR
ncbi:muramidase (phage lambda lysozyme) [Synechococcus sp. PCC 7502]|uniref:glycoside hydrolase family 24 protein n=1 Tax=Synechococcus sp. PCC 7502 TaxID=1173263 RepID=UPI00029FB8AD|nr:glycoside hydrolase family 104 protein [Synechococcus sp. PCC 7502]AFY74031.1 muramidase (phage lambda lysozyme) [Synechococcus sp. PCC 7502]